VPYLIKSKTYWRIRVIPLLFLILLCTCVRGQEGFTSYFTGNAEDLVVAPSGGVCLMGGATEDDNAMRWFLTRARGGDVLVLRTSGSDGYNDYLYSELGVSVNSVETIVFDEAAAAGAEEVAEAIMGAEAIWFAGGNQANYVAYWRGTPVDSLIRVALTERNIVIGGTSAGMAILAGHYFSATNGTISSEQALADPFNPRITIDSARFMAVPQLANFITDTHFDDRNRRGRLLTFLARGSAAAGRTLRAIACDEYTAVCIETDGTARVFGDPDDEDYAYFVRPVCYNDVFNDPSQFAPGQPLTWGSAGGPFMVAHRVKGSADGSAVHNLNSNNDNVEGVWQTWWADEGIFEFNNNNFPPDCITNAVDGHFNARAEVFPNPTDGQLTVTTEWPVQTGRIIDAAGRTVRVFTPDAPTRFRISTAALSPGSYYLLLTGTDRRAKQRFIVP
jgi:cyanophycinase-like exopeptidase